MSVMDPPATADTESLLHQLLDPAVAAGVLSQDEWQEVLEHVRDLMTLIGDDRIVGEPFWIEFRDRFDFVGADPSVVPMSAANLCPEPAGLIGAANFLRARYNRNVAMQTRMGTGVRAEQLRVARQAIAGGLGCQPDNLALVRNASEGNNAVNCGYRGWRSGDNVVLWAQNHPTNLDAWHLRSENGTRFRVREVSFNRDVGDGEIADAFLDAVDGGTRFVSYSMIANGSGFRIPDRVVAQIWNAVKDRCHVHVDGTMVWGARHLPLEDAGGNPAFCHSFVSSGHKWFLGPKETGVLYMTPSKAEQFVPSIFAYDYSITMPRWQDYARTARRFEYLGQRDDVNLIILTLTQGMWSALSAARLDRAPYDRVKQLSDLLVRDLVANHWTLVTPQDEERRWGIVRVEAKRAQGETLSDFMYGEGTGGRPRFAGFGDRETFRLCPHIYNTTSDITTAVGLMNAWRSTAGAT